MTKNLFKNFQNNLATLLRLSTKLNCAKISQKMDFVVMGKSVDSPTGAINSRETTTPRVRITELRSVIHFGYLENVAMDQGVNFRTMNVRRIRNCWAFVRKLSVRQSLMPHAAGCSHFWVEHIYDCIYLFFTFHFSILKPSSDEFSIVKT